MTPLARLLGRILPEIGKPGAAGLPEPHPLDFIRLRREKTPNSALAGPAGFSPSPDMVIPVFPLRAERLIEIVEQIGQQQQRTTLAATFPVRMQLWYVVRSRWLNLPDLLTVQAMAHDEASSTLLLYSRSVYGYSDFGVNRRRLAAWIAAINAASRRSAESPPTE